MKSLVRLVTLSAVLLIPCVGRSATTLEREFRFGPERVSLVRNAAGTVHVQVPGAVREHLAGRPDLPLVAERIELPAGARVARVELLEVETTPLERGARLPSALALAPGLTPEVRTAPDPEWFGRSEPLPASVVELGAQGAERGRGVAVLRVAPVRWTPATGLLERVDRVRVRLVLEADPGPQLVRERVVPEWEDGAAASGRTAEASGVRPEREAEPFKPTQLPSLLGSPVAYLIVTGEDQVAEYQRLADWKTQSGTPAVVRTMSFVRQHYPFGADDAERLRLFLRDAYTRWGTKWVMLGGDTEVIPTRLAYTAFYGGEYIACDMYFSCLEGNWNADGDSLFGEGYLSSNDPGDAVDLFPEVYVGRAPTTDAAQARLFVDKTLMYDKTPVSDYITRDLAFAEVLFPQDWQPGQVTSLDGAELVEDLLPVYDLNPNIRLARLYQNPTDPRWRPGAYLESRQAVIDSLNSGYNVSIHVGHGYRNVMSVGDDNLTNADAFGLVNGDRLTNLYAINCTSNAIDFPSIGEAFLLAPAGGAVTNVGSTRFDFPTAGRAYQLEYFTLLIQDSVTAVGELQARQKLPFIAFSTYDGVNRWTQMTLLLLGDPELRIYTGTPRPLLVTHPANYSLGDTELSAHVETGGQPLAGARVTAYRAGDEYASALTDGSGNVTLPFRPDSAGSLTLTVTAFDCAPYQGIVPIVAGGVPVLSAQAPTIDDDGTGGTVGNSDGLFDAGETVDLLVPVRNNGASSAPNLVGTLSTSDPLVTILSPVANYGSLGVSTTGSPVAGFRVTVPFNADDQREIPFTLLLQDGNGFSTVEGFQVVVNAPELRHHGHGVIDAGGNLNGRPDPGETVSYFVKLRNLGTGIAQGVSAKLRSLDGLATVTDSLSEFADIAAGQELQGDPFEFTASSGGALLQLRVSDQYGELWVQRLDIVYPSVPTGLLGVGAASTIDLTWARALDPDLLGYNIYRSTAEVGPYVKINPVPTGRTAYYEDSNLAPLTRYYYRVSAVDSSGNESGLSAFQSASTNPPSHGIFPIPMGRNTPAPVAIDHVYPGYPVAIAAGAEVLYVYHPDGSAPVDADGAGTTSGDFTTEGAYYAAGPSIADLDGGDKEIVGPSWDTQQVFAFDKLGAVKPGWPVATLDPVWSGVAIGDLDADGDRELVFGSNGDKLYAFRHDGTELLDGDANPATTGVFKVLGGAYNFGTPALADLDGNGQLEIVYAAQDAWLYAWRPNGLNLPGFPRFLGAGSTASVAIGYLDGAGDAQLDIVAATADSLFAFRADGSRRFALWTKLGGTSKQPSPALADMNRDGYTDIVIATTSGTILVFNRNGQSQPPWAGKRFSTLTNYATESSPVVADISGDGWPDVVIGDENGQVAALSGADGSMLPGFPIQLEAEVRGAPALCDCDGDGLSELVVSGWDKNVYQWDYDFPFSPGQVPPWPQFHHDAARTGLATNLPFVGVEEQVSTVPAVVRFAPPAPNPARGRTRLTFGIPADRAGAALELALYDLSGRRVRLLERGVARPGEFAADWDLRTDAGSLTGTGVYFARLTLGTETLTRKLVVVR